MKKGGARFVCNGHKAGRVVRRAAGRAKVKPVTCDAKEGVKGKELQMGLCDLREGSMSSQGDLLHRCTKQ